MLEASPHPDLATVGLLRAATATADALVAIGSGTINDLCKYTAARTGKPYVVFATAPSMNGYTSMNAAITVDGHKKSLPATAPLGVFIDLGIFAKAPLRMIQSGLGDSLCRWTACRLAVVEASPRNAPIARRRSRCFAATGAFPEVPERPYRRQPDEAAKLRCHSGPP